MTRTVELFCGIGGFRLAADALSLDTVWANDSSPAACATYTHHWGSSAFAGGPYEQYLQDVPDHAILTAGFPCQPFSSAGKKKGRADLRANTLDLLFRTLERIRPARVVLENVPFLLAARRGEAFQRILAECSRLDYSIEWRIVNAAEFGLPQHRPRVLLLATLEPAAPRLCFDGERPLATVLDQADRYPAWGALEGGVAVAFTSQREAAAPAKLSEWLDRVVPGGFDFTYETRARLRNSRFVGRMIRGVEVLYNQNGGSRMGYTVYGTSGLAPTLTATTSRHYERFLVGNRFRRLTPWEYLRLQGFPDHHCDAARPAERYRLAGNAIPPPLAHWALSCALGRTWVPPRPRCP